jgi:hypothetical protein
MQNVWYCRHMFHCRCPPMWGTVTKMRLLQNAGYRNCWTFSSLTISSIFTWTSEECRPSFTPTSSPGSCTSRHALPPGFKSRSFSIADSVSWDDRNRIRSPGIDRIRQCTGAGKIVVFLHNFVSLKLLKIHIMLQQIFVSRSGQTRNWPSVRIRTNAFTVFHCSVDVI